MKNCLLLCTAILICVSATAQIRFGIKGGITAPAQRVTSTNAAIGLVERGEIGWQAGAMVRINLLKYLFIQPEINYTANKFSIVDDKTPISLKYRNDSWDIPVLVGFKVLFFHAVIGPTFNVSNKNKILAGDISSEMFGKRNSVGIQGGLGLDFGRVTIDARYSSDFGNKIKDITYDKVAADFKKRKGNYNLSVELFF